MQVGWGERSFVNWNKIEYLGLRYFYLSFLVVLPSRSLPSSPRLSYTIKGRTCCYSILCFSCFFCWFSEIQFHRNVSVPTPLKLQTTGLPVVAWPQFFFKYKIRWFLINIFALTCVKCKIRNCFNIFVFHRGASCGRQICWLGFLLGWYRWPEVKEVIVLITVVIGSLPKHCPLLRN